MIFRYRQVNTEVNINKTKLRVAMVFIVPERKLVLLSFIAFLTYKRFLYEIQVLIIYLSDDLSI